MHRSSLSSAAANDDARSPRRLSFWPLVAATFFMVSGGTYGTEDILHAGYGRALLILLITPVIWSLPTTLMIGELASALPDEGGFYAWVRRAMGDFWGFQEAWLSLVASVFDMAIYPTLFVAYLVRLLPWFAAGHRPEIVGLAVIAGCVALNLAGIRAVGTTSVWLFVVISAPFVAITMLALFHPGVFAGVAVHRSGPEVGVFAGLLVAMWNYMGWDNASTVAAEVEHPRRTYPLAMSAALLLVTASYVIPTAAMWLTRLTPAAWETGSWAEVAAMLGGPGLRAALVIGGMIMAFGMFNALVMSYSRLPLAMAQDGLLPPVFARLHPRTRAPWVAILVLAAGWALCLGLGFERLVTLDVLIYGLSLLLEFVALLVLRLREPRLPRPFRVPGGTFGAVLVGVVPTLLLAFSVVYGDHEQVLGMNSYLFGLLLVGAGFLAYAVDVRLRPARGTRLPKESK